MKLTINDKEIELKYSMRSMMLYENITQKSFTPTTMTDLITFMYCVVVASSKDYSLKYDEFIDYLDENPTVLNEFSEWIVNVISANDTLKKN